MKHKKIFLFFIVMGLLTTLSVQKVSSRPHMSPCQQLFEEYKRLEAEEKQIHEEKEGHRADQDRREFYRLSDLHKEVGDQKYAAWSEWRRKCGGRQEGHFL